jgi:ElaB/YqjD/DUF883 family membrane-anchored ribosome-binding protein
METTQANEDTSMKAKRKADQLQRGAKRDTAALEERVEHVRELVDDLRDRAEMAFHERPYLLPVATGAVGLGVGVLIGSRLSRVLFFTAAGALLSDTIRGRLLQISREFINELGDKVDTGEDVDEIDGAGPSVT